MAPVGPGSGDADALRRVRVLVAEDHPMFREGLVSLLSARSTAEVVAAVGTGRAAVAAAEELRPDVAVVDLRMPDGDGAWVTAELRERVPTVRVLVLTSADDDRAVQEALAAGARGYLLKTAEPAILLAGVQAVADGATVLSADVLAGVTRRLAARGRRGRPFPQLTEREFDVLEALAEGRSTEDTARRLGLTPKTVRNVVSAVLVKTGAKDRTAAATMAARAGLGAGDPPDDERARSPW